MPYLKIWVHVVWATKRREHFLRKEIRKRVFDHMRENAREKGIHLDFVNGYTDHVHCLISLGSDQTVANVVQMIKGESSFWINQQELVDGKFGWQSEYFAVSVSESKVNVVRNYIKNQEAHHSKVSFEEEYDQFVERYSFLRVETRSKS